MNQMMMDEWKYEHMDCWTDGQMPLIGNRLLDENINRSMDKRMNRHSEWTHGLMDVQKDTD